MHTPYPRKVRGHRCTDQTAHVCNEASLPPVQTIPSTSCQDQARDDVQHSHRCVGEDCELYTPEKYEDAERNLHAEIMQQCVSFI